MTGGLRGQNSMGVIRMSIRSTGGFCLVAAFIASNAAAQDAVDVDTATTVPDVEAVDGPAPIGPNVFDGDWVSIGVGAAHTPSYTGSNDYTVSFLPIVQGSFKGIDLNPRAGGLALDFVPDRDDTMSIDLGVAARIRSNRANDIEDPVVESLGELDTAIEVGPTAGLSFPKVLHGYDSLSVNVDARWDVAGAHEGFVVEPSVTYFTPLSRGIITALTVGAEYANSDFNEYYFSVSPEGSAVSGLPTFAAKSGWNSVNVSLLGGFDLDNDATNGGLALITIAGYARLLGDAKDTPSTRIRGDADQYFAAVGIGYTF